MGIFLNPGNEGFKSALRSKIYVDKTEIIEYTNSVLDTEQRYICVSRPRRFGKSITAGMLAAYYGISCDSESLFQNLKIAEKPDFREHLNQYHVIHVDMNVFRHRRDEVTQEEVSAQKAVDLFHVEVIRELRMQFQEAVAETYIDLPTVLANINQQTGTKFVIIIDEWDAIFREDKLNDKAQRAYINLLRGLFKAETAKRFLKLGYLTGILPIKKYGTESALNNFDEFTMLNPDMLAEYVGFTEEEVQSLYQMYDMDFKEAKRWYDGYALCQGLHIYNPKSVVDSIRRKKIANYWTGTESYESLKHYIGMNYDGLKDAILLMLAGNSYKVDTHTFENDMVSFRSKDDVLTVLIHLGYLAYQYETEEVYIPNEEVKSAFRAAVKNSNWDTVVQAIAASDDLMRATWRGDEAAVADGIGKIHAANTSILTYNDENSLSCVIALAYYNAMNEYTLIREMPSGYGFADIVFIPKKHVDRPAMIVELKWNQSAKGAIAQVKKKQYVSALEEYQGNLLLVGINYDKETKEHTCVIEQLESNQGI